MRAVTTLKSDSATFEGHFVHAPPLADEPDPDTLLDGMMIGSPAKIAAMIEEDRATLSPAHFSCFMQFGGIDTARAMRSMERFMGEVVPRLEP